MKSRPTVAELIKELERFSPDLVVCCGTERGTVEPLLGSVGTIRVLEVREGLEYRVPVNGADERGKETWEMLFVG